MGHAYLGIKPHDRTLWSIISIFLGGLGIIKIIWKHWAFNSGQVASARAQPPSLPLHVHKAKAAALTCHLNLVYSNRYMTFSSMQASNQLYLFLRTAMIGIFYAISKACSSMRTGKILVYTWFKCDEHLQGEHVSSQQFIQQPVCETVEYHTLAKPTC